MTKFVEHDDRLVAMNDEATKAVVWGGDKWRETGGDFPRKAWLEGTGLTRQQAAAEFPEADLAAIPDLK